MKEANESMQVASDPGQLSNSPQAEMGRLNIERFQRVLPLSGVIVSGGLLGLAWAESIPPWFGLVGLGVFFQGQATASSWRTAAFSALATGTFGFLISCNWLLFTVRFLANTPPALTWALYGLVCIYQGSVFLVFSLLYRGCRRMPSSLIWMPCLWVLATSTFPTIYPCEIGTLLADYPALTQIASIGGTSLLSLLAATMALLIPASIALLHLPRECDGWGRRHYACLLGSILTLTTLVFTWGAARVDQIESRIAKARRFTTSLRVVVVQADTEKSDSHQRMFRVSRELNSRADLIIWPECSLRNFDRNQTRLGSNVSDVRKARCRLHPMPGLIGTLLAGADTYQGAGEAKRNYVSAVLMSSDQIRGFHDKIKLMPYGEFIPGERWIPQLRSWFGGARIIQRGQPIKPIGSVAGFRVGTVLCCEDMYPALSRSLARQGMDILVCLGNGMAFDSRVALRQHFRLARLRAVESGRYFIRCTSRGTSAVITPSGKIESEIPCLEDGAFLTEIPQLKFRETVYTTHGPSVVRGWMLFPLLIELIHWMKRLLG